MHTTTTIVSDRSLSLRSRLILAIVVLVTLISSVFVIAIWEIKVRLEAVAFGHMVEEQLTLMMAAPEGPASLDMRLLPDWALYTGDALTGMPATFAQLPPGSHHSVRVDDNYYQVEVSTQSETPAVLTYDITEWENQEHRVLLLMVLGIALMLMITLVSAVKASAAVLTPLRQLTERIAGVQPQQRGIRLSAEFTGNEVGRIAQAFDAYLERLDGFVAREKYFTTAASHELRTPLSVVTGAIEVLESQSTLIRGDAAAGRAINRIKRACHDMLGFIEVSLLLSREEARPLQSASATPVKPLVEHLIDELQPQLAERNTRVTVAAEAPLQLDESESLIQIVISNLLRNAVEHTVNGEITVRIKQDALEVSDSGEGIPTENMERVFENSFSTKAQGTGLGLNLVQRLCERLSWQIELQSEPGRGTRVQITFHPR
ncbi:sensor histidine kinase [Pseudohongiella sp.]|uniref:histidine kinase n=1 Tax=marine sediment metagenome TaxID=412755 RepID=A0A0F9W0R5_9ZZZZ|nr:HAMP domain-containing sensor histidine kinase [Pseudohongiella sp.]HDZ08328.1 HAMP domain-containing histidine kinase [Pseudohongiella sp.]HEA62604.1 HAMP domain-containing histidine kinase [Pseudohongiella sp.]